MNYDTPAIVELGSVADFTRANSIALDWDGRAFHRGNGGGTPTS
jgi:hypothetical protein